MKPRSRWSIRSTKAAWIGVFLFGALAVALPSAVLAVLSLACLAYAGREYSPI